MTDALRRYARKRYGDVVSPVAVDSLYQDLLLAEMRWCVARLDAAGRRDFLRHIGVPADAFDWRDVSFPPGYRIERLGEAR